MDRQYHPVSEQPADGGGQAFRKCYKNLTLRYMAKLYCLPSFFLMNSSTCLASSSERFWLGMRTRQTSSIFCAAVSFSIISSTLVTKFMIHSGVLRSVTPFHPGPTSFSSVS